MADYDSDRIERELDRVYDGSTGESWSCLNDDCPNCTDPTCSHHCHEFDRLTAELSTYSDSAALRRKVLGAVLRALEFEQQVSEIVDVSLAKICPPKFVSFDCKRGLHGICNFTTCNCECHPGPGR